MASVVVAGAGPAGLAAAARLARLRHDVVLVEREAVVGGRWRSAGEAEQRFTLPAALRDLFLKTGKPLESVVDLDVVDARRPTGAEWDGFLAACAERWDRVRGPLLETPLGRAEITRLARTRPWRLGRLDGGGSVATVARRLREPRLRALVEACATSRGLQPASAPAAMALLPYLEQTFRVWQVGGGLGRLLDALHERALDRGVVVLTGAAVSAATTSGGRVDGVRLADGRRLPADVVVTDVGTPSSPEVAPDEVAVAQPTPVERGSWRRHPLGWSPAPGLLVVGRSAAFGPDLPFVVLSAAAVADRVGRA